MEKVTIRTAAPEDAAGLLEIYAPYVEHTAVTFEYEVPTAAEFEERIRTTLTRYPWLMAERDGVPLGYAYAGVFHARPAYDWSVETSLYVRENARRQGVGKALHDALAQTLRQQGILNLNACIAVPAQEDPYLTRDSVEFHTRLGYRLVGEFFQCGYKFGRWYNMVWMEKHIGPHLQNQPPVIPYSQLITKKEEQA